MSGADTSGSLDVLDWLKQGGKGYQTRVNKILRAVMEQQRKKAA